MITLDMSDDDIFLDEMIGLILDVCSRLYRNEQGIVISNSKGQMFFELLQRKGGERHDPRTTN